MTHFETRTAHFAMCRAHQGFGSIVLVDVIKATYPIGPGKNPLAWFVPLKCPLEPDEFLVLLVQKFTAAALETHDCLESMFGESPKIHHLKGLVFGGLVLKQNKTSITSHGEWWRYIFRTSNTTEGSCYIPSPCIQAFLDIPFAKVVWQQCQKNIRPFEEPCHIWRPRWALARYWYRDSRLGVELVFENMFP